MADEIVQEGRDYDSDIDEVEETMAEVMTPYLHLLVAFVGTIVSLLPLLFDSFHKAISESELRHALYTDFTEIYLTASIAVTMPLTLDLVLDICSFALTERGSNDTLRNKFSVELREWIVRFLLLLTLLVPSIVSFIHPTNRDANAAIFCCFCYSKDVIVPSSTLFALTRSKHPIWNIKRTLPPCVLIVLGFLIMQYDLFAKEISVTAFLGPICLFSGAIMVIYSTLVFLFRISRKAWGRGSQSILDLITKDDFFLITNSVLITALFFGIQIVYVLYTKGPNFLSSRSITLVAYQIVLITYTVILTVVPAHIARHETTQVKSRLSMIHQKVSTKIAPALHAINKNIIKLQKPDTLRSAYLDPSFQESVAKMHTACSEAMTFADRMGPEESNSLAVTNSDSKEDDNDNHLELFVTRDYWSQFEVSEFSYSERASELDGSLQFA